MIIKRRKRVNYFTYEDARAYLDGLAKFGTVLGLENMTAILEAFDHPEKEQKIIHIAGTNGKGSTGAFIASGLKSAGYKAGRYVSPTVFSYEERYQLDGVPIPKRILAGYVRSVKEKCEENGISPTVFEVETAVALLFFRNIKCDFTLIEVGMGGRLDATNAVSETFCSVITPIALDHMAYLGDTIEKIAFEKAGIIKPGGVVFSAVQTPEAKKVLKKAARAQKAQLTFCGEPEINDDGTFNYGKYKNVRLGLKGDYQYQNAVLAIEVLKYIGVIGRLVKSGLYNAKWPARFQVIEGDPVFIFDGAHNPQGVEAFVRGLEKYENITYICGIFADKDYEKMVSIAAPRAKRVITITPPSPRGLDAQKLRDEFLKYLPDVTAMPLEEAIKTALTYKGGCVAVFGSLSFLGEAIGIVKEQKNGQR